MDPLSPFWLLVSPLLFSSLVSSTSFLLSFFLLSVSFLRSAQAFVFTLRPVLETGNLRVNYKSHTLKGAAATRATKWLPRALFLLLFFFPAFVSKARSRGHDNSGWALTNISIIPERYDKQHAVYPGARLLAVVRLPLLGTRITVVAGGKREGGKEGELISRGIMSRIVIVYIYWLFYVN